ncbi:MAG: hypothetical protein WC713_13670 [Candidatus Methylomirabilota bacterium]
MYETWTDILVSSFRAVLERLAGTAPRILAMGTLILLGLVAASLARRLAGRILQAVDFDRRAVRWGLNASLLRAGLRQTPTRMAERAVFWVLFLIAVLMGIEALGLPATSGLTASLLRFLPHLIVAALVMVVGWLVANFLGQATLIAAVNLQITGAPLAAAAVRWLVVVFAGAAALTQLGIAREMVLLAFGIAFGGAMLAVALAFGLGGQELARRTLERWLRRSDEDRGPTSHL